MESLIDTELAFAIFLQTLKSSGPRAALAYLLKLTDYRFIAIFRFQDGMATAALFYDRENPEIQRTDEVPATATYCCYARDARGVFTTANALLDPRLTTHVAREAVQTYCGIPVMTAEGDILGTLCHYDTVPRDPDQIDLSLMLQVASALEQSHLIPEYPKAA